MVCMLPMLLCICKIMYIYIYIYNYIYIYIYYYIYNMFLCMCMCIYVRSTVLFTSMRGLYHLFFTVHLFFHGLHPVRCIYIYICTWLYMHWWILMIYNFVRPWPWLAFFSLHKSGALHLEAAPSSSLERVPASISLALAHGMFWAPNAICFSKSCWVWSILLVFVWSYFIILK